MAGENLKRNLKDRVDSVKVIPDNAVSAAGVFMDRISELKPVQAVAEAASHLGDGVLKFVDKQCEITRRWTSEIRG